MPKKFCVNRRDKLLCFYTKLAIELSVFEFSVFEFFVCVNAAWKEVKKKYSCADLHKGEIKGARGWFSTIRWTLFPSWSAPGLVILSTKSMIFYQIGMKYQISNGIPFEVWRITWIKTVLFNVLLLFNKHSARLLRFIIIFNRFVVFANIIWNRLAFRLYFEYNWG